MLNKNLYNGGLVMCLIVEKGSKMKLAEEDIVCYKMLRVRDCYGKTSCLCSPFQHMPVRLDKEYETTLTNLFFCNREVYEGFHSFQDKDEAVIYCKAMNCNKKQYRNTERFSVVKSIIPKGSYYYEGLYESGILVCCFRSFASEKIKYTNEFVYHWVED